MWAIQYNTELAAASVGMSEHQVLTKLGEPAYRETTYLGGDYDARLAYQWADPIRRLSACERWIYVRDGLVVKVYDASSP